MESLDEQILALQLEIASLKRTAGRLYKLEKQYQVEQAQLNKMEQKTAKEYEDILKAKKKGWIDLFIKKNKEKEENLEREKQEYFNAAIELKNAERAVGLIKFEINILKEKVAKIATKEKMLQGLKRKKEKIATTTAKQESDEAILLKNRIQIAFHRLSRSATRVQVHLEEMESSLNKIETWLNWHFDQAGKERLILEEEFENIEKALENQRLEFVDFQAALQKLSAFKKHTKPSIFKDFEKIAEDCNALKIKIESLTKTALTPTSKPKNLQNELTKLKAKINEIQYEIDLAKKYPT